MSSIIYRKASPTTIKKKIQSEKKIGTKNYVRASRSNAIKLYLKTKEGKNKKERFKEKVNQNHHKEGPWVCEFLYAAQNTNRFSCIFPAVKEFSSSALFVRLFDSLLSLRGFSETNVFFWKRIWLWKWKWDYYVLLLLHIRLEACRWW